MAIRPHINSYLPLIWIGLSCLAVPTLIGCNRRSTDTGSAVNATQSVPARIAAADNEVELSLVPDSVPDATFVVKGLPAKLTETAAADRWPGLFQVYVGTNIEPDQPPMLGAYAVEQESLVFQPEFGLEPGQSYTAVFLGIDKSPEIRREFAIPPRDIPAETHVTHVFPSREHLPQNLLKFYLHFSAPMRTGDSYRHIHLIGEDGQPIDDPFLELHEELWDDAGTRMTLLFDPGRIKKGLKPREDVGPPLLPGRRYTLLIDAQWHDAQGNRLISEFRKAFDVDDPDETQPAIDRWRLETPSANSTDPLEIRFDESMDRAMLDRIFVVAADKAEIAGRIEVADVETTWRFFPERPWQPGKFAVIVETTLEDVAGNSLDRPFEVDLSTTDATTHNERTLSLPFEIAGAGGT